MARKVKDKDLGDRTARTRLPIKGKPHYRSIETGLHIGYRRLRGRSGTWVARHYVGEQSYVVEALGTADDLSDADHITVLSFDDAVTKARKNHTERANQAAGITGPLTVDQAMTAYVTHLDHNGKKTENVERAIPKYITPLIGKLEVGKLTSARLNAWKAEIAAMPARGRSYDARARKSSANRTITTLKAALNLAYKDEQVASNVAWRSLERFKGVDRKREQFLSVAEAKRLINAADDEFRPLIQAALLCGCRYGELCNLKVLDFDPDSATISIERSKSGRGRKVYLTAEGVELFKNLAAGRKRSDPMIRRNDGSAFGMSHQIRRMRAACERAGIDPVPYHCLRHSYASALVKAGVPLFYVAQSLGHTSIKMVQEHYGHLEKSHLAETIRASVPSYGIARSNVRTIR